MAAISKWGRSGFLNVTRGQWSIFSSLPRNNFETHNPHLCFFPNHAGARRFEFRPAPLTIIAQYVFIRFIVSIDIGKRGLELEFDSFPAKSTLGLVPLPDCIYGESIQVARPGCILFFWKAVWFLCRIGYVKVSLAIMRKDSWHGNSAETTRFITGWNAIEFQQATMMHSWKKY